MSLNPGLRERKAARTREAISRVAIELFCERGFDAVTMSEIADAAEVGRATLFAYYPTKDALVIDRVGGSDPCRVVAERAPGVTMIEALRAHYEAVAARFGQTEAEGTKRIMGLVAATPALMAALARLFDRQRDELAALLAAEDTSDASGFRAQVAAAQAIAVVLMLQSRFYQQLVAGGSTELASRQFASEVNIAFGLLGTGIGDQYRKGLE
jgi:AcrR family transcriptional regulator